MPQTSVRTHGGHHTTITARHHVFHADSPISDGGGDTGATPEELLLGAIGACATITAKMYAERKGWPLKDVAITLDVERKPRSAYPDAPGDAQWVHEVTETIELIGELDEEQRTRIREIMSRCPVRRIVTGPVFFLEELLPAAED
jgi:putative redox protein